MGYGPMTRPITRFRFDVDLRETLGMLFLVPNFFVADGLAVSVVRGTEETKPFYG